MKFQLNGNTAHTISDTDSHAAAEKQANRMYVHNWNRLDVEVKDGGIRATHHVTVYKINALGNEQVATRFFLT